MAMIVPEAVPNVRDMLKDALPNLMTSARASKAGAKGGAQSGLHSPRTVRKIVYELASTAAAIPTTSATTSGKDWAVSNSLPIESRVNTTDAFGRRRSCGDALDAENVDKPALQNQVGTSGFSLSRAAQGVFHSKAKSHKTQNGRQVRVGSGLQHEDSNHNNSSSSESECVAQGSCGEESDFETCLGGAYEDITEPDAEPDSMMADEQQRFTFANEAFVQAETDNLESHEHEQSVTFSNKAFMQAEANKIENHEHDNTREPIMSRTQKTEVEYEQSSVQKDSFDDQFKLTRQYEVEKQSLTARFMGAREQVEQLKHKSDQQSAYLLAEQRFRKEAEEEIARLRNKCMVQAEDTEELRRNMRIKEQMEMKFRMEKEKTAKENQKLKSERAQLAKEKTKLQSELLRMAQLRSKVGAAERAKPENDNLAGKIADMECSPLKSCAPEDKASLKKKLLLKWHPDKQPSPEQAMFATQVVQEMQNRSVWKD